MGRDHFPWVGLGRCLGRVKFVLGLEEQAWRDGEENERGGGGGGRGGGGGEGAESCTVKITKARKRTMALGQQESPQSSSLRL